MEPLRAITAGVNSWTDFGLILYGLWVDSAWILDLDMLGGFWMDSERFWVDSGSGYAGRILGEILMESAWILNEFWIKTCNFIARGGPHETSPKLTSPSRD